MAQNVRKKSLGVGKKRDLRGPVAINDRLMVLGLSMTFGSRLLLADGGICGAVIAAEVENTSTVESHLDKAGICSISSSYKLFRVFYLRPELGSNTLEC